MSDVKDYDASVVEYDEATKLRITAWVLSKLARMATEGGSFRTLIYGHLGFDESAYDPLFHAGGMDVTNALHDAAKVIARGLNGRRKR